MYINMKNVNKARRTSKIEITIGVIILLFWSAGCITTSDLKVVLTIILMMLPGVWLIYSGNKKRVLCNYANEYSKYIRGDSDGEVLISTMAKSFKIDDEKLIKIIKKLIQKDYVMNFHLDLNEKPKLILYTDNEKVEFVEVYCTHCGATNKVKKGFVGNCSYCNSVIGKK
ncbi:MULTISPECIES: hypothetical protein [Peptoniphilus]|uniref:hypothetical protein n=1 Tax=Peptoniphilus TaxID=162289 RepID=UPI0001DA9FC9|nr:MULTISPECIES: hypothetical protein [Peptoniphilus]EFI41581.1 hypothetical protein HMPREF0629_00203 [Peptoniphilus sp. oral taxon 386 str. F0131]